MKSYKKLKAAEKAYELVLEVYRVTEEFPKAEQFGLTSQLKRAAVSVLANLVEGQARRSKKEFRQLVNVARGSLAEVEVYLELARDLGFLTKESYQCVEELRSNVGSLTYGLIRSLKSPK